MFFDAFLVSLKQASVSRLDRRFDDLLRSSRTTVDDHEVIAKRSSSLAVLFSTAVGLALVSSTFVAIISAVRKPPIDISDFAAFWRAGRWLLQGRTGDLFPDTSFGGAGGGSFKGFVNPPHVVVSFLPLALLSLRDATFAFAVFNGLLAGSLATAGWRFLRRSNVSSEFAAALLLMAFGSVAVATTFVNGSLSLFVTASMVLVVYLDRDGDRFVSGVGVALLSFKPQYAILPFVFLIARRRWRAAMSSVVITAIAVATTVPLTGLRPWSSYPSFLNRYAKSLDIWNISEQKELWLPRQMLNVRGLLVRMLGATHVSLINTLSAVVLLFAVALVGVIARRTTAMNQHLMWAAVVGLTVVTSQHTNVADGSLLFVALFVVVGYSVPKKRGEADERSVRITLLAVSTLNFAMIFGNPSRVTPIVPWSAIAALAIVGSTVKMAFRVKPDDLRRAEASPLTNATRLASAQPM